MKIFLAISVISCLLVVAYAIDLSCTVTRVGEVTPCITRLPNARTDNTFCTDCANALVGYYQDCTSRSDIDALVEGEWLVYLISK